MNRIKLQSTRNLLSSVIDALSALDPGVLNTLRKRKDLFTKEQRKALKRLRRDTQGLVSMKGVSVFDSALRGIDVTLASSPEVKE